MYDLVLNKRHLLFSFVNVAITVLILTFKQMVMWSLSWYIIQTN